MLLPVATRSSRSKKPVLLGAVDFFVFFLPADVDHREGIGMQESRHEVAIGDSIYVLTTTREKPSRAASVAVSIVIRARRQSRPAERQRIRFGRRLRQPDMIAPERGDMR